MTYNKPTPEFIEKLNAICPGRVYTGADINPDYSHDEMPSDSTRLPDVAVKVETTEEIAAICKLCYEYNVPFIARGAGTGLSGGAIPVCGGVLIDTTKMNKILGIDMDNGVIRAQAGCLLNDVAEACAAQGVMYAPDPGEKFATIGGNVICNAGGMRAYKYGTTRDAVRKMTVVTPTGKIVTLGAEVSKNTSGYNLMHLMIGSEGTLGIVTEVSLKFVKPGKFHISLLGLFDDLDACASCVCKLKLSDLNPQALEMMDVDNVIDIEKYLEKEYYPKEVDGTKVNSYLLTTLECDDEAQLEYLMEHAGELFVENGALDVIVLETPKQIADAWKVRGATMEMMGEFFKQMGECDVVVPTIKIPEFIRFIKGVALSMDMEVRFTGHAGDGNIHVTVVRREALPKEEFAAKMHEFLVQCYAKGKELGGLPSGEHGIGLDKVPYLETFLGEDVIELMRAIKTAFDPKHLLNPGKVVRFPEE